MSRTRSAPTVVLGRWGLTVTEVAERAGSTRQSVGHWLSGVHPAPEALFDAIGSLAGKEAAQDVRAYVRRVREAVYAGL